MLDRSRGMVFGLMPIYASADQACAAMRRQATAMLVSPAQRISPIAVLPNAAAPPQLQSHQSAS